MALKRWQILKRCLRCSCSPSWDTEHLNRNNVWKNVNRKNSAGCKSLPWWKLRSSASTYTITYYIPIWLGITVSTTFNSLMRLSKTKEETSWRHRPHIRHICVFLHSFVTGPVPHSQRHAWMTSSLIGLETGNLTMPWNSSLQTRHCAFGVNGETFMDARSLHLALVQSFNRRHGLCTAF